MHLVMDKSLLVRQVALVVTAGTQEEEEVMHHVLRMVVTDLHMGDMAAVVVITKAHLEDIVDTAGTRHLVMEILLDTQAMEVEEVVVVLLPRIVTLGMVQVLAMVAAEVVAVVEVVAVAEAIDTKVTEMMLTVTLVMVDMVNLVLQPMILAVTPVMAAIAEAPMLPVLLLGVMVATADMLLHIQAEQLKVVQKVDQMVKEVEQTAAEADQMAREVDMMVVEVDMMAAEVDTMVVEADTMAVEAEVRIKIGPRDTVVEVVTKVDLTEVTAHINVCIQNITTNNTPFFSFFHSLGAPNPYRQGQKFSRENFEGFMRRTSSGAKARVHTGRGGIHHSPNPRGLFSYNTLLFAASILVIFLFYQPEGGWWSIFKSIRRRRLITRKVDLKN